MRKGETNYAAPMVILAIVLQVFFVFAEEGETPSRVARGFSEKYFSQDAAMARYLCKSLRGTDNQAIQRYILRAEQTSVARGYAADYQQMALFHLQTRTTYQDESHATVHLTAEARRDIHPAFTLVGRLFRLGTAYRVEETLEMVQENGFWKVCGAPYDLIAS